MDASDDGANLCPLCMEKMDLTDRQLKPCHCGYEICVWCWHRIMEMAEDNSEGRCPACRTPYAKERIVAATVSCDRLSDFSNEKQKSNKAKAKAAEGRKNLGNVRVIQHNLVYVVGIPANLADEEIMEQWDFFGQYGKILKISVSKPSSHNSQHSISEPTASVYVTYVKEEDALCCIQTVDGYSLGGRPLKACFGTTKYCNVWLKNMQCNNPDCLYLHDEGTRDDSFTKEEMLAKFGRKNQQFHNLIHPAQHHGGIGLPPPLAEAPTISSFSHSSTRTGSLLKPLPANGSVGKHSRLPEAAPWCYRGTSSARSIARPGLANVRPGSVPLHQVVPTLSSHTASGAVLLSGMSTSATAVAATSSRASYEPSRPFSTGLSICATLENDRSQPVVSMEFIRTQHVNNDAQNTKSSIAEVTDDVSVSACLCGSTPAKVLKDLPTESQSITLTAALKTQAGIGKISSRSATIVDRFGVQGRSAGMTSSHCFQQEFGQHSVLCDEKTNDVSVKGRSSNIANFHSRGPMSLRKLPSAADDWSQIAMYTVDNITDVCSGFHGSCTGLSGLNSVEKSGESYHATSVLSEDDRSASELAMVDPFSLVHSGRVGRFGELSPVSSSPSSSLSDTSVACSSIFHAHLSDEADKDLRNTPMNSLQSFSTLNVGGLSTVSSSHQSVSEGSSKTAIHVDEFLRDPCLQVSLPDSSPRSCGSNRVEQPYMLPLVNETEQNSSIEKKVGSLLGDQHFGMESASRISEAFERKPVEGTGESQMVSDMFSMGYDIWADGTPHDLANLVSGRKDVESVSALKELIDWKVHSSKQSRFHFARKEDLAEESYVFPNRSYSQNNCSMPLPTSEYVHIKQMPVESCSVKVQKNSGGCSAGLTASDGSQYARCKGRPSNAGHGNDSTVTSTPICSRSSIITPPGFGLPTRVSSASSLGFRPHVASQFSETCRSVSRASIYSPLQTVSNSVDIGFIDPAIMAVGKETVPASLGHMPSMEGSSNSIFMIPTLGFTSPVNQRLRPVDADSSSLVQQGKVFGDVTSLAHRHSFGIANQDVDIHLTSLFPYLSEYVSPASLERQYQGDLNCSLRIHQSACVSPESQFQKSIGHFQESWSGLGQSMDSITARQRLGSDVVRQTSDNQQLHEGVFQNYLEDMRSNKKNVSNSFWEAVGLSGQNDQGKF